MSGRNSTTRTPSTSRSIVECAGAIGKAPPWWTEADQAELDVLVNELVRAGFAHRAGCSICSARAGWCEAMRDALEGLVEWRRGRELRSKAAWLRAREMVHEERAAA
jgi:hypothetical protein